MVKKIHLLFKLEKIWYGLKVSREKGFGGDEKVTRFGLHKWETSTWNNSMAPTSTTITFNSSSCLPSVHVEELNFIKVHQLGTSHNIIRLLQVPTITSSFSSLPLDSCQTDFFCSQDLFFYFWSGIGRGKGYCWS